MDASFLTVLFVKAYKSFPFLPPLFFPFFPSSSLSSSSLSFSSFQKKVGCFEGRIGGSEAAVGGVSEFTSAPADGRREF